MFKSLYSIKTISAQGIPFPVMQEAKPHRLNQHAGSQQLSEREKVNVLYT